jgi:NAD(P)-dependent dehydrogenase (short-subunit alcohol dehydrogenase family)
MLENYKLKNKRVLILGSCGVLGLAHCEALINAEVRLIIADRPGSKVLDYAKSIGAYGLEIDATEEKSIINGVDAAAKKYGGLDGAVYNAAITSESLMSTNNVNYSFDDYPLELWQRAIDVNLTGAFLFARAIGRHLKASGSGSLINVASIYGVVAPDHRIYEGQNFQSFPAYSATKSGIIGLSKWLATLWAKDNVRVNSVSPGGVLNGHNERFVAQYSQRTPFGRMANRDEISGILLYLLSNSSSYCTGQNIVIDGGLTAW